MSNSTRNYLEWLRNRRFTSAASSRSSESDVYSNSPSSVYNNIPVAKKTDADILNLMWAERNQIVSAPSNEISRQNVSSPSIMRLLGSFSSPQNYFQLSSPKNSSPSNTIHPESPLSLPKPSPKAESKPELNNTQTNSGRPRFSSP
jgi:hypothetical protein